LSTDSEQVALIAYRPSPLGGPYAEVGPVFVHAEACRGFAGESSGGLRERAQCCARTDADGLMLDGIVAERGTSEDELKRLFNDPEVALVHVRNLIAGCWNFSVRRKP